MFEKIRFISAICAGKALALIISLFGRGATAAPGLLALKIDPNLITKLSKKIPGGAIVVTGTNGKTTTSRLIFQILSNRFNIIHNRQGSNLLRGIASTLIKNCDISGNVGKDLALWEIDEAVFPVAVSQISPKISIILNLFRDQLDRYGEIDSIRNGWENALKKAHKTTILVLNADDPGVSILAKSFNGNTVYFGINSNVIDLPETSGASDVTRCLNCGHKLEFSKLYTAHLGNYSCPSCNFKTPKLDISASDLKFTKDLSTNFELSTSSQSVKTTYKLPGLYNVYNVLAASSVCTQLKIPLSQINISVQSFTSAFGRFQNIDVNGKKVTTLLIKNPAGANEVLRAISKLDRLNLLVALNDKFADGRDVSWIWDTNWGLLSGKVKSLTISGLRAWDMALRIKYAQLPLSKKDVSADLNYSIRHALNKLSNKDTLIILPTYTALLEIQKILSKKGGQKWQHQ